MGSQCRGADDEYHQEQQSGRAGKAQHGQRYGADQVENHQYMLDVQSVAEPTTANRADDGADIEHDDEVQRRAEAESRHRHQLGQPGIERIYHEQAGNERRPDHYCAETTTLAEQIAHRRILFGRGCVQADEYRLLADGQLRFDLLHDGPQFLLTVFFQKEGHRLGHALENEGNQQHRQAGHIEHRLPAMTLDQLLAGQGYQNAADGIAGKHQGHQACAQFGRREFTHLRGHHRQHTANAQAGDEARDAEADRVAGQPGGCGEQAEQCDADGDHLRPADAVGQGSEEHGTEHGAEECGAGHDAGTGGIDAHVVHDGGQRGSHNSQVVAVNDEDQYAPEQDESVKTVEFRLAGKLVYVHRLHDCVSFNLVFIGRALWALLRLQLYARLIKRNLTERADI